MHQHPHATPPDHGRVLREGRANHQRGRETVGGRLTLTDRLLVFTPHSLNLQTEVTVFPLSAVRGVRPAWSTFLGVIPLAPNSMTVAFADGSEQSFVVPARAQWIADVQRAVAAGTQI